MASYSCIFSDKEIANWFRVYAALKISKGGLEEFIDKEILKLWWMVGKVCGNCCTENVIKCPTRGICSFTDRCNYHNTPQKQPRRCPQKVCKKVKNRIKKYHRYKRPWWQNTNFECLKDNHWHIARCFLPPEYSMVSSVQETDFNGLINIMMNNTRFDELFSFKISSPQYQQDCLLTKARLVSRAVCRNLECKITDAELDDYMCTLTTLLRDPRYLSKDPNAIEAFVKVFKIRANFENPMELQWANNPRDLQVSYSKVLITSIGPDLMFYAQNVENGPLLEKLMEDLRIEMETNPPLPGAYRPKKEDMCAAKFKWPYGDFIKEGRWYRAKIVEIGLTRVGVFCVDYGESMRQYATQIAQLPSKFTLLTPQAKKYQLAFVKLPDETDPLFHEAHFAFETAIRNRQLLLNVEHCIGDVESVSLSDPDSRYDVAKGLIIARHGREKGFIDVLTEYYNEQKVAKYSKEDVIDYIICIKIWAEESKEVKEAYESDNNQVTYHKVVITKVDTDLKFIAQTVENGSLLKKLMEHLRIEMMTNPPLPGAYTPKTGDMCAAPFSEFNMSFSGPIQYNQWCRAKIKEIKGSFVELLFVDYGVSGEIPANEIARLDSKFTQLSPQAQKYKLAFVRPPDDDSAKFNADRAFKNSILHHQFLLNVENCIGDVEMVSLCDLDSKNNVAKSLITAGLVLCEPGREQCFVSVLSENHKAQEVEKKIRNDALNESQTETLDILNDAYRLLDNAKKAGKQLTQTADMALLEMNIYMQNVLHKIEINPDDTQCKLEELTDKDINKTGTKRDHEGKRIYERTRSGIKAIQSKTQYGLLHAKSKEQSSEQKIVEKTRLGVLEIEMDTQFCIQDIEEKAQDSEYKVVAMTKRCVDEIEKDTQLCVNDIEGITREGELKLELKALELKSDLHEMVEKCEKKIDKQIQDGVENVYKATMDRVDEDYERDSKTLVKLLKEHYGKRLSHISLSPLMPGSGKCILDDVYVSPKICSVDINPMGKRKNVYQIGSYEELFYSSNKLNRKIFIQGEPGCGKSTFTAKMVLDWCIASNAATQETQRRRFMDIEKLKIFKFIFYISLRDSGDQNEVVEMMKDQIIRKLFSTAKHEQACKLIETIMTTEECLVILDGWDEWTDPHCKEPVPVLVESYQHCTVLTTTRVWKMKSRYMKDSDIGTLLELEGVLDPRELSEVLLSRLVGEEELYEKRAKFHFFITQHNFNQLIVSPVMLSVMVCSWIDEIHVKGSLCEIYSVLLECLFKKAAEEDTCISDPLQLSCLENKVCLQTNIEHLKCLSKTAFCLLFSDCRERSVVFTDKELSKFMSKQEKAFALKTGIITERECSTLTKESSTLCFFHKSVQEFLAAIHIAINSSVIQEDIARYLNVFPDAYLYIAQVFISLCGLNVIAASELSGLMDEHNDFFLSGFQKIICDGYKEAKSNEHDDSDINLKLSIFYFADHFNTDNLRKILMKNTSNVRFLHVIPVDTERSAPTYRRIYRSDDSDTSDTEKDKGTRDYFFDLDQIDVHEIVRASSHCLEHLEGVDEIPIDLLSKCKKLKQ